MTKRTVITAAESRRIKRAARAFADAKLKNDRVTVLAAAIMAAGMQGSWGTKSESGKHTTYTLTQIEDMATKSAIRLAEKLPIYRS